MPDLIPASAADLIATLTFSLRHKAPLVFRRAEPVAAELAAAALAQHLLDSGFVLMRKPPAVAVTTSHMMPDRRPGAQHPHEDEDHPAGE